MIRYITAYRNNFGKCQQFSVKIMVTDFVNQGSQPHSPIDIDIIDNLIETNEYSTYSVRDFWQGQIPTGYSWFTRKSSNLYQQIISIDGEPIYTGSHALRLFADNIRYGIFLNPVEENSISPTSITYLFTNSNAGYLPTGGTYYSSDEDGYYLAGSSLEINNMRLDTKVVIMSYLHESVRYAAVFWRDEASGVWRCPTTYSDFNITDTPEYSEYVPEEPYKPGGTVTISLYKNNSEKNVIGKSLKLVRTLKGTFKQEVDISNLSIQVDLEFPNFNYIRVPSFNRYYFVDSVVNIRDNLWEISCHVDVLESFKDTIMSTYGLIERNEFEFNPKIIDHLRVIEQGVTTEVLTGTATLETVLSAGVPQTMTETSPRFMLVGTFMNLEGEIL